MTENDYGPDLAQARQIVMAEMMSRLTVDLSEMDFSAVATAITKMAYRAAHIGASSCQLELRARGFELPAVDIVDLDDQENPWAEPDPWAEEYGDADEDG